MSELLAGYGERPITPPLGVDLVRYGFYLERRAESVLDDLKARALSLRDGRTGLILVSCDLLGLTVEFTDSLRRQIAGEHALPAENVVIACTHTHSGPASQLLRGMGEVDPRYLALLETAVREAAAEAVGDESPAECSYRITTMEPIGYNRRSETISGAFCPIDPALKVLAFRLRTSTLLLLNYACHPVTLYANNGISADWPGALVAEMERRGCRAVFFQGFCGDINPVTRLNDWGGDKSDERIFYARMVCERALKSETDATALADTGLRAAERRVDLPLAVPSQQEIEDEVVRWESTHAGDPSCLRFIRDWRAEAEARLGEFQARPYVPDVPVQAVAIGGVKVLGLPGEVFCEYALELEPRWRPLLSFGTCQGNAGYFPTPEAYSHADDYACYMAPKFYGLFPFRSDVGDVLSRASEEALASVSG